MPQAKSTTPTHIAIIMDGNRRWAKKHGLQIIQGHQKVAREMIERLADHCILRGIKYLTLWAFSTENWNRDTQEISGVMSLFREAFDTSSKILHKKGMKIKVVGDMSRFPEDIQKSVAYWIEETKNNQKLIVTFALNYGGRDEIVRAVEKYVAQVFTDENKKQTLAEKIANQQEFLSESEFAQYFDSAYMPDPDLIIRPGGELRMSGFFPWQGTYSEYYFTDILMPDFDEAELDKALEEYAGRQRRFGK